MSVEIERESRVMTRARRARLHLLLAFRYLRDRGHGPLAIQGMLGISRATFYRLEAQIRDATLPDR